MRHAVIIFGSYGLGQKTDSEKAEPFFIIATNFNETSMTERHIGSDYFPWLLLSKFLSCNKNS